MDCDLDNATKKVFILIDMDSFEVQVWGKQNPEILQKPYVVHNSRNKIIAVNYLAKSFGVSRSGNISDAKKLCSEIGLFQIPDRYGKPDQKTPRHASREIQLAVEEYVEAKCGKINFMMSSRDEMYFEVSQEILSRLTLNYTKNVNKFPINKTKILNGDILDEEDQYIEIGGIIAGEIINLIKAKTDFQGSAGVGTNKLIAKLACTQNKPAGVTIVTKNGVDELYCKTKLQDGPGLGGRRGLKIIENFKKEDGTPVESLYDFKSVDNNILVDWFGVKVGKQMKNLANGVDESGLENKLRATIICSRMVSGLSVKSIAQIRDILEPLSKEMIERITEEEEWNNRKPKTIKVEIKRGENRKKLKPASSSVRAIQEKIPPESGTFKCPIEISVESLMELAVDTVLKNWNKIKEKGFKVAELKKVRNISLISKF